MRKSCCIEVVKRLQAVSGVRSALGHFCAVLNLSRNC